MIYNYQESLLKMTDEVNQWRTKKTEERFIVSSMMSTLRYANRYFLEGGSYIATKTTGTGAGKPLIGTRFASLFRFEIFHEKIDYKQ